MQQEKAYDAKYKLPLFVRSTKPILVKNTNDEEIGVIRKYFNNLSDRLLDQYVSLFNKTNYKVSMLGNETSYEGIIGNFKETLFRSKWKLEKNGQEIGELINKTKIITNPYFTYTTKEKDYVIQSDFLDKNTFILDKSGEKLVRVYYENVLSIRDVYIKTYTNNSLSIEEILIISVLTFNNSD